MSDLLNTQQSIRNLTELKEFWSLRVPLFKDRCILLLSGDVGAGKTTSVQMIAEMLGMKGVQSPSFAIHLQYENSQGKTMDHVDLYRLKDEDDLESSGFWDLFSQQNSLIVIEWADRLALEYLPLNWQRISVNFQKVSDSERILNSKIV